MRPPILCRINDPCDSISTSSVRARPRRAPPSGHPLRPCDALGGQRKRSDRLHHSSVSRGALQPVPTRHRRTSGEHHRLPLFASPVFGQVKSGRWISIRRSVDFSMLTQLLTYRTRSSVFRVASLSPTPAARLSASFFFLSVDSHALRTELGQLSEVRPRSARFSPMIFFSVSY
jgi:hypothetical protein